MLQFFAKPLNLTTHRAIKESLPANKGLRKHDY